MTWNNVTHKRQHKYQLSVAHPLLVLDIIKVLKKLFQSLLNVGLNQFCRIPYFATKTPQEIREFGIKTQSLCLLLRSTSWRDSHFFTSPILFREYGFLSPTRQSPLPSFAFSSFRECAFYALIMHYQMNRHVKCILDGCSMLSGILFQLNWNIVPTQLEQGSILTVIRLEPKKLTTRACGMGNERWRLEVRRVIM